MKLWRTVCLIGLGAMVGIGTTPTIGNDHFAWWEAIFVVSGLVWGWLSLGAAAQTTFGRLTYLLTGRQTLPPRTDPQALAAEMAALNAQIAQLRDTATSFDVSFDQTLQRLDERLRRVEQQSPYVRVGPGA